MKKTILFSALALALAAAAAVSLFTFGGSRAQAAACPQAKDISFTVTPAAVRPGELVTFEWRVPAGVTKMTMGGQYDDDPTKYDLADRDLYASIRTYAPDLATRVEEAEDGGYVWRQTLRMEAPARGDYLYTVTAQCDAGGEPLRATAVLTGVY